MYCRKCGNELKSTDAFCVNCGERVAASEEHIIESDVKNTETKFDRYMKKHFCRNKEFTYEEYQRGGKVCVAIVVIYQFLAMFLLLFFDIEIPTGIVYFICWLLDCYFLNRLGVRGFWKIWGLFVIPVYLFIRAKKTDKKYSWAVVSLLVCLLGIGCLFVSEFYVPSKPIGNDSTKYQENLTTNEVESSDSGEVEGNSGKAKIGTDNIIEFSNGLRILIPESWAGKCVAYEGSLYFSVFEKENYEKGDWEKNQIGRLFDVQYIFYTSELSSLEYDVLGYLDMGKECVGVVVSYPNNTQYDYKNTELLEAYCTLLADIEQVKIDTSKMEGFVPCDEETMKSVLR